MAVFKSKRVLFKAQYLFHCASESVQTQYLYRQVLGLYKSKVRLVYNALFQSYKASKNTYRFAVVFFFFWEPAKKPAKLCLFLITLWTMHHILNELWLCIDPISVYTKSEFGLILMSSGRDTVHIHAIFFFLGYHIAEIFLGENFHKFCNQWKFSPWILGDMISITPM